MSQKPIKLKFECSQDWNAMKATSCGRFCSVCNKEVIDFTGKSKKEFDSLITKTAGVCGRFNHEQLDPSLISPISLTFHRKAFLFVSTVMITILSKPLSAQSTVNKTETVIINPGIPVAIPQPPETVKEQEAPSHAAPKPFIKTKKRRYYLSKRFPFIVARRYYASMGCPSF